MKPLKKPSRLSLLSSLLFLLLAPLGVALHADELAIPVGHQGAEKTSLDRPKVGMTTAAVEAKFGAPLHKTAPVGKPPISSWEYPLYYVYFESDRVIHSVLKPYSDEPAAETAPAQAAPAVAPVQPVATDPVPVPVPAPAPPPAADENNPPAGNSATGADSSNSANPTIEEEKIGTEANADDMEDKAAGDNPKPE
jgi:hypothetical protein